MKPSLAVVRNLLFDLPVQGKLAYCLLRDERVPVAPKAALLAALGLIVSPLDIPLWMPVFGELDALALIVVATKIFIEACPEDLVEENRRALAEHRSRFEDDTHRLAVQARVRAARLWERWGGWARERWGLGL